MKGSAISPAIDLSLSVISLMYGPDAVGLLREAAGIGAQVSLFEFDQHKWPWATGKIENTNSHTIELSVGDNRRRNIQPKESKKLIAQLYYKEHVYQFATVLVGGHVGDTVARLSYPEVIEVCERRRYPRRALRRKTSVQITLGPDNSPCAIGAMLNVSAAGLACRVTACDALTLTPDMHVRTTFALDDINTEFSLVGRVVNKSESGTPGYCIVGIEFDDPADEAIRTRITREIKAGRSV